MVGRRLLDAVAAPEPPGRPAVREAPPQPPPTGPTTRHSHYRIPVLQALVDLGSGTETADALARVHELAADVLPPADREHMPSGRRIR